MVHRIILATWPVCGAGDLGAARHDRAGRRPGTPGPATSARWCIWWG